MEPFALFNFAGTTEYALTRAGIYLPPWWSTWDDAPLDEALDGSPYYGRFVSVVWDYTPYGRGVPQALVALIGTLREANGDIRIRTRNAAGAMVVCTGKVDRTLGRSDHDARARSYNLSVTFTRVVQV